MDCEWEKIFGTTWKFQSLSLYIYKSRLVWILINSLHSRFCDWWPGYVWPWKWSMLLFITWNSERETDWPLWLPVSWCIAHHHHHHHHHHHLTGFCPKSSVLSTLAPRLIRVSQAACIPAIAARWRGVCFFWKSDLSQRKIFVSENSEYFVKYWYNSFGGGWTVSAAYYTCLGDTIDVFFCDIGFL